MRRTAILIMISALTPAAEAQTASQTDAIQVVTSEPEGLAGRTTPPTVERARNPFRQTREYRLQAEHIGEQGAREFAQRRGWTRLLDQDSSLLPQGFDQGYLDRNGRLVIVEAKSAGSKLGVAYEGARQGSPKHAIKSADRVLRSDRASKMDKRVARLVLEHAEAGTLRTAVVRTPVTVNGTTASASGVPTARIMGPDSLGWDQARVKAHAVLVKRELAASGITLGGSDPLSPRFLRARAVASKGLSALAIAGVAIEVAQRWSHASDIEEQYSSGTVDVHDREIAHAENAGGGIGGLAGAWVAGKAGATAGGSLGAMSGNPVIASATAVTGALTAAYAGYTYGGEAGAKAAAEAAEYVHERGTTVASAVRAGGSAVAGASGAAWQATSVAVVDGAEAVGDAAGAAWNATSKHVVAGAEVAAETASKAWIATASTVSDAAATASQAAHTASHAVSEAASDSWSWVAGNATSAWAWAVGGD